MQEFTIKQGASLPYLVMELNKNNVFQYIEFYKALENAVITFSMIDTTTNIYKVTQKAAGIILKNDCVDCLVQPDEYFIYYQFSAKDTNKVGRYRAEFQIVFPDNLNNEISGNLITPISDDLFINITPSLFIDRNGNNNSGGDNLIFSDVYTSQFY